MTERPRSSDASTPAASGTAVLLWTAAACGAVAVVLRLLAAAGVSDHWLTVPVLAAFPWVVPATVLAAAVGAVLVRGGRRDLHRQVAVLALAAAVAGVVTVPRTIARSQPAADGAQVTVGAINVRRGLADPDQVVDLVQAQGVDVLVVVELTAEFDEALSAAGLATTLSDRVVAPTSATAGGGVYARGRLAVLRTPAPGGDTPDVIVTLADGAHLEVVSTHPVPPIGPRRTRLWRTGLSRVPDAPEGRAAVVAGDLNATVDHAAFRDLLARGWRDAAREAGAGLLPTYDGFLDGSPGLPMAIDHVLVGRGIAVRSVSVHDVAGTDHRMLVADLQLP